MKKLKCIIQYSLTKPALTTVAAAATLLASAPAHAGTGWVHGGHWAANNVEPLGIMYPNGITSSTTPSQAAAVADTVACDFKSVGINFVRYGVDPATVSGNWAVTQAAINELISQGMTVDICCFYIDWQSGGTGQIVDMTTWEDMWRTVDGVYGSNSHVYYEPINEPFGYSLAQLESVYSTFLGLGLGKGHGYYILDGTGYADNVTGIGGDATFNSCLLAVHDYPFWDSSFTTEAQWESQLQGEVGSYYSRTIMTEMAAVTTTGLNYGASANDNNISFIRGLCNQCRTWGMGFSYYAAEPQPSGNNKMLFYAPGCGVVDPSMVIELQYGWNLTATWHAWDNPAGGSGFNTAFAACSWGPMREDVFGVKSGNIYHTWWFDNSGWNAWEEHACPVAPSGAPGASANNTVAGREDIYYIGTDGNLYHQYYSAGSGWQPSISTWNNLGAPAGAVLVGSPSATSWAAGRYDVYVRASNNGVYHAYSGDGINYTWTFQGGSVTNDVASESWGANRLDGYALGTGNGEIWHQYWDGSAWNPTATTWAQNLPETNAKYALGAASWGPGRIDLFDNNGSTIGHIWYDNGAWNGNWSQTLTPPATPVSGPCATSWVVNRVDAFVLGSNGDCYHVYWGL